MHNFVPWDFRHKHRQIKSPQIHFAKGDELVLLLIQLKYILDECLDLRRSEGEA